MPGSSAVAALAAGRLRIDLGALADNWRAMRDRAPDAHCAAAVKGDGYGIGLLPTVTALTAAGCRSFFTALPEEGQATRAAAPEADVYVLDGLLPGAAPAYADARLVPVLGSWPEIEEWSRHCVAIGARLPAALHIDTGMNRLGLRIDEAQRLAGSDLLASFDLKLVMSHLACASTPDHALNETQRQRFAVVAERFPGIPRSLANSAGVLLGRSYHFDMVRPGIALYGGAAIEDAENPSRPVVTAEARILQTRTAEAGETVGYGATQTLTRPTRLAMLGSGYADGYHRLAGTGGSQPPASAWIAGHRVPLVGRVSMDLIAVDVTDVPEELSGRGDWVELFGANIPVDTVARHAETISYELLTALGRRSARHYVGAQSTAKGT